MPTAVLFSGQPRFLEECFPYIYQNILRPNGMPDVFAHLWYSPEDAGKPYKYGGDGNWQHQRIAVNAVELFESLYSPKALKVEPGRRWTNSTIDYGQSISTFQPGALSEPDNPVVRIFTNNVSWYRGIFEVNLLRKDYEWAHDIHYDTLIRTRTDIQIMTPVVPSSLDLKSSYYYADIGQPASCVCDWINVGDSMAMDIACRTFYDYNMSVAQEFDNGKKPYCNEVLLRKQLERNHITPRQAPWRVALPRF